MVVSKITKLPSPSLPLSSVSSIVAEEDAGGYETKSRRRSTPRKSSRENNDDNVAEHEREERLSLDPSRSQSRSRKSRSSRTSSSSSRSKSRGTRQRKNQTNPNNNHNHTTINRNHHHLPFREVTTAMTDATCGSASVVRASASASSSGNKANNNVFLCYDPNVLLSAEHFRQEAESDLRRVQTVFRRSTKSSRLMCPVMDPTTSTAASAAAACTPAIDRSATLCDGSSSTKFGGLLGGDGVSCSDIKLLRDTSRRPSPSSSTSGRFYQVPNEPTYLMGGHAKHVPCSPWASSSYRRSTRPMEPLPQAKLTALLALALSFFPVAYLVISTIWANVSIWVVLLQVTVAIISFFGFLWNAYSFASSIVKCFMPTRAFHTNTRYCSILPEAKDPSKDWPHVTIQATVYKESFSEVIGPTLESLIASRNQYIHLTDARCNVVVCDDAIMDYLDNDFAAATVLWDAVQESGDIRRLSDVLRSIPKEQLLALKNVPWDLLYKVYQRMAYYNYYNLGFVARSTLNRRGRFKKAGNMNTHLRLAFGADQLSKTMNISFDEAVEQLSHTSYGLRTVMHGNDIEIGVVMAINDADSRMPKDIVAKTVPEFLNDDKLGFTQHATKTLEDQRGQSCYLRLIESYTDFNYQGHFLTSSILGFHPPLVGHSAFVRSEALRTVGHMRSFRQAQTWLRNIGLDFLSVDQVGNDLQMDSSTVYWSEDNASEDFEVMINLYNLGYDGRFICYPDSDYQEGVTRTFDEEAERQRRFSVGAHELMYNPFAEMFGKGFFKRSFWSFLTSDIPGYYKIYLTSYLLSYTSGGTFVILYTCAALTRLFGPDEGYVTVFYGLSPFGFIALNILVYYIVSNVSFFFLMIRMYCINKNLFFVEYRKNILVMLWKLLFQAYPFQFLFFSVMANYCFLGSMDHLMSFAGSLSATNKDAIDIPCWRALIGTLEFNRGSFLLSCFLGGLAGMVFYSAWLEEGMGIFTEHYEVLFFVAPAVYLCLMSFVVPFLLNPYIWCGCATGCGRKKGRSKRQKEERQQKLTAKKPQQKLKKPQQKKRTETPKFENAEEEIVFTRSSDTSAEV